MDRITQQLLIIFINEIKELEKGFQCYYTSDNNIRHVAFSLLYHSADRPERQSILNTLGEGTYGKVTNYAMEINPTKFPACKDCYKRLISNLKENTNKRRECNNCFCWNINPNDPKQQIMKVPDKYPQHNWFLTEMVVLGCSLRLGASLGGSTSGRLDCPQNG